MAGKHQPDNQPGDTIDRVCITIQRVHEAQGCRNENRWSSCLCAGVLSSKSGAGEDTRLYIDWRGGGCPQPQTYAREDTRPYIAAMRAHVGCSGWFYWHWRGRFYPENSRPDAWFRQYAATFNTVELNAPFYRWPHLRNVKGWVGQAPEQFRYSVKVNRIITHEKRLVRTRMLVEEFCNFSEILGPKLGCFLFQFPPSYHYTASRLRTITTQIDPMSRCVIEFRHSSWWRGRVYQALRRRRLIFCTVSAPRLPDDLIRTADTIYVRLHGRTRWYRHDYTSDELAEWARKILNSRAREAWIYFDNDREGFAIKNARELTGQLQRMRVDVR